MARKRATAEAGARGGAQGARAARSAPALGPGLHGAVIELKAERTFQIRTTAGQRLTATLDAAVDPALADECLREGRMVIVVDGARGPSIVGALQTAPAIGRDPDGVVAVDATELRVRVDRAALLEVGAVTVRADASGALRLEGDKMVIDMAALVRILALRVELP